MWQRRPDGILEHKKVAATGVFSLHPGGDKPPF